MTAIVRGLTRSLPRALPRGLTSMTGFGGPSSLADLLLTGETDGLGISFLDNYFLGSTSLYGSARVKDTATPANNYSGTPYGLLPYTSPSVKYCRQADGNIRYGAHNRLLQSEDFTSASWTKANAGAASAPVITLNAGTDPLGGNTANRIQLTLGGGTTSSDSCQVIQATTHTGEVEISIWLRSNTGSSYNLELAGAGIVSGITVTPTWQKFTRVGSQAGSASFTFRLRGGQIPVNSNTADILAWGAHHRATPSNDTYLRTTTTARYALPYEWDANLASGLATQSVTVVASTATTPRRYSVYFEGSGSVTLSGASSAAVVAGTSTTITPTTTTLTLTIAGSVTKLYVGEALGILPEPARTNLALYNRDLTNAAWTKTNCTAAKTATGVDNVANSASTLTATGANATCLQSITSGSAARINSCFIKRRTGSGVVEMTQDNGTTWTAVTVTADWTRVEIPSATVTNPIVGLRIVTSGDEVDVDFMQQEVGAFVSSPIWTLAATVTRAVDNISLATSLWPFSGDLLTMLGSFVWPNRTTDLTMVLAAVNASGTFGVGNGALIRAQTNVARAEAGGNGTSALDTAVTPNFSAGVVGKIGGSFDDGTNTQIVAGNGDTAVSNTTLDWTGTGTTQLQIGALQSNGTSIMATHLRDLKVLPRAMTGAELTAGTAL